MSIKVNYPRTSQTQVYNVFVNQSSAKNHASPSLPLFLIVSFKCSKQAQCRHRFQAVMLFAVPPSSSLAAFFVLQGASLISASFHSAVRKLTTLNFIPLAFVSAACSPAAASYFGSPACRRGLRAVGGRGNNL